MRPSVVSAVKSGAGSPSCNVIGICWSVMGRSGGAGGVEMAGKGDGRAHHEPEPQGRRRSRRRAVLGAVSSVQAVSAITFPSFSGPIL
jgi:hypothetical protein